MFSKPIIRKRFNSEREFKRWVLELLVKEVPEYFIGDETDEHPKKKRRSFENTHTLKGDDYWSSTPWGQLLDHPDIDKEGSEEFLTFRGRFRMTPRMFRKVTDFCRKNNIFGNQYEVKKIPLEFKILAALRILARDVCIEDVKEGSGMRRSTILSCFHKFISGMSSEKVLKKFVSPPQGDQLKESLQTFEKLGFPGCIGSIDCTHIRWDHCPHSWKNNMTSSKEAGPTVKFEVVVDHNRRVLHVSEAFTGVAHDQSILENDTFPSEVNCCTAYKDMIFTTKEEGNYEQTWEGVYFLSDQGYAKQRAFIEPTSVCITHGERLFSEWIESVNPVYALGTQKKISGT